MTAQRIAIVGGGPAGLTAALTARKLGLAATVFEQAADFRRVGGGLLLHSNGQRVLHALGLLESFEPQMVLTPGGMIVSDAGVVLAESHFNQLEIPFNRAAVVLRHQLQEHMLEAARQAGVTVRFDHRCAEVVTSGGTAVLKFENKEEVACDIVLACDGVNSRVREQSRIEFKKISVGEAWLRGVATVELTNKDFREIWGDDGRRFGLAPLAKGQTYFYARVPAGAWDEIRDHRLGEWIDSWRAFGAEVQKVLRAVPDWEQVNYSELSEVKAPRWYEAPIFLVGDAAHAMTPNLGQGANSAMVDALVLTQMLRQGELAGDTPAQVGARYDALRRPFVTRIQAASRQAGALAAWTSAPARSLRRALFSVTRNLDWARRRMLLLAAGYNPQEDQFFSL